MAAGAGVYFGSDFTVSSNAQSLSPDAAQAINALGINLVFRLSMGGAVRYRRRPGHLAHQCPSQVAWRRGLCHRPRPGEPTGVIGLLLLAVWSLIAAILLIRRGPLTPSAARSCWLIGTGTNLVLTIERLMESPAVGLVQVIRHKCACE
jgi:hypothetical protein